MDLSKNFLKQIEVDNLEIVFKFKELYNQFRSNEVVEIRDYAPQFQMLQE